MSNHTLPKQLNPVKICRQAGGAGQQYDGILKLGELPELAEELREQAQVPVQVSLDFCQDAGDCCVVKGAVSVTVSLVCQRCLKAFDYPLQTHFTVSPVQTDEAAKQLPGSYEPLMVTEGEINVATWIAEELHLALPLAPRHEPSCESRMNDSKDNTVRSQRKSPFEVLKGRVKKQ